MGCSLSQQAEPKRKPQQASGEDGEESDGSSNAGDVQTDAFSAKWFWGHADSRLQPPPEVPGSVDVATLALKLSWDPEYNTDLAKSYRCPHYLHRRAFESGHDAGCPFLGGTAHLKHAQVVELLRQMPSECGRGAISRKNELGYLRLSPDPFPGVQRKEAEGGASTAAAGSLSLGCSNEEHRLQRRWLELLLRPERLPSRDAWAREVGAFLEGAEKFQVRRDVAVWWQQMLWRHVLSVELSKEDAVELVTFQSHWVQSAVDPLADNLADYLPQWVANRPWGMEKIAGCVRKYRAQVEAALPKAVAPAEVPEGDRELVAEAVLEMLSFTGGQYVPDTIVAAIAVLYTPELLPSPVNVTEENVDAFVFEVTRLFPPVEALCYWRGDRREVLSLSAAMRDPTACCYPRHDRREILSLSAALRDPAVWGAEDAHRFSLKRLELYKEHHVGFAAQAQCEPGGYDSRSCPGVQLSLDVVRAFVLAISAPRPEGGAPEDNTNATPAPSTSPFWSPSKVPKPTGPPGWWKDFTLEHQDWLDGDQTGENLLKKIGPVELGRLSRKIGFADLEGDRLNPIFAHFGPKRDRNAGTKLVKFDSVTRIFFELTRKRFKELSSRKDSLAIDSKPAKQCSRYYELQFPVSETIKLPLSTAFATKVRDTVAQTMTDVYKNAIYDDVDQSLVVKTQDQRKAAILLCQEIFYRHGGKVPPPNSQARADSYLPKAKHPFNDISTDASQVAIARCGMGQLYLRQNKEPDLAEYGDVLCDVSAIGDFEVRPAFERLGAAAVFDTSRGKQWTLTAIRWVHKGVVVKPGDDEWEHAKWVWRCSLITHLTAVHHLMWTHWIMSNSFSSSIRECLSPAHPIRRALQVHSYNTPKINHNSVLSLYPECGMLHRMSPFTYSALVDVFDQAASMYKFRSWGEFCKEMDLPNEVKEKLPMFEDGLEYWDALFEFYSGYVGVYYESDADVQKDQELQHYWAFTCVPQYAKSVPTLSKAALIKQMTQAVFDVTALHKFVGDVVVYTTDPAGAAMQVRAGLDMCDLQQFVQVNSLVAGTGTPMPMFVASGQEGDEEWLSNLNLTEEAGQEPAAYAEVKKLHGSLMARLKQVSANVKKRNKSGQRERQFCQMDPMLLERSVSL